MITKYGTIKRIQKNVDLIYFIFLQIQFFSLYQFIEKPQEYAKTMLIRKLMFYSVKRIFKIIFTVFYKCLNSNIVKTQCIVLYNTVQHQYKRV